MCFGLRTLDLGLSILHLGFQIFDSAIWALDCGLWALDFGPWTFDSGFWVPIKECILWHLCFGFRILQCAFWVWEFVRWLMVGILSWMTLDLFMFSFGLWVFNTGSMVLDFVCWASYFAFGNLDFGVAPWASDFDVFEFYILDVWLCHFALDSGTWSLDFGFRFLDFRFNAPMLQRRSEASHWSLV